jgi:hypothetical protein
MKPKELIVEAISLLVEERAIVVDSILRSLNSPEDDIDRQWIAEETTLTVNGLPRLNVVSMKYVQVE